VTMAARLGLREADIGVTLPDGPTR
jgi:hypothetical protein